MLITTYIYLQVFFGSVPPKEDRDKGDEDRAHPGSRYHTHGGVSVHKVIIVERFDDGIKPIKWDSTEVQSAHSAGVDIDRVP